MKKTIAQGAEATLFLEKNILTKERFSKGYRIPELDNKLTKARTKKESKLLEKAHSLIPVPKLINSNEKNTIQMEFISGKKLSESLDSLKNSLQVCKQIGENIAKLHDADIIHGDLTTSNMIYAEKENKVYFLDFGLGYESNKVEDKAVDLHLIKQALEAKHFTKFESFFAAILSGYSVSKNSAEVIKRLKEVEQRGRYKKSY